MKIRGKNTENWTKEKKEEVQKVLDRMEKTRKKDDMYLREKAELQLKEIEAEKSKVTETIKQYKEALQKLGQLLLTVNGKEEAIKQLLAPTTEPKNDTH